MTTADPETRIADLKARWEADPSSRIFVQLADEHRRAGNTAEAIEVLKKGLATQPNYVTAQAALGRCHLAAGDAGSAIEVLSRVMEQDPSHPLAGKLLVEAHLQTGDLDAATQRLEHYRMVADSGPELEDLEERLADARREQSTGDQPTVTESESAIPPADDAGRESDDVFDLGSVELSIPEPEPESEPKLESPPEPRPEPFDLPAPPEAPATPVTAATSDDPFQLDPLPQSPAPGQTSAGRDEPFGDLMGGSDLARWNQDLDREGIFQLDPPAGRAAEAEPDEAEPDEAEPVEEAESEEATVTLGQLYMAQGHRQEAARIFRSVLERDPNNEISRRALAELEGVGDQEPQPEEEPPEPSLAASLPESSEPPEAPQEEVPQVVMSQEAVPQEAVSREPAPPVGAAPLAAKGITERKITALEDYLHRLRQAARS